MPDQNGIHQSTVASNAVQDDQGPLPKVPHTPVGGQDQPAIQEDNREEATSDSQDDWLRDPQNPRNWSYSKKWVRPCAIKSTWGTDLQCFKSCIGVVISFSHVIF